MTAGHVPDSVSASGMAAAASSQAASVLQIVIFSFAAMSAALVSGRATLNVVDGVLTAAAAKTAMNGGVSSTAMRTRSQGRPYGIHITACVQARYADVSSAGHPQGTATSVPAARRNSAVVSHRLVTAAVPYSIGQPASAAVVIGSVNMRGGKT